MKKRLLAMVIAGILGTGFLAVGCGGNADSKSEVSQSSNGSMDAGGSSYGSMGDMKVEEGISTDSMTQESEPYEADEAADDAGGEDALLEGNGDTGQAQNEKRIYIYHYSVETKEFDDFLVDVTEKTEALGGYIQESETNGSAVDNMNRYASMTLRIPADKMDQMLSMVKTETNVLYSDINTQDVTLNYVDMESHIKALRTEQKTLLRLIEQADKIEDVIALQSQLTQVRYEIESYESKLRAMDNLVTYSTLNLDISEVERTTTVVSTKTGFIEEVKNRFSDNLYAVGQWLRGAAVWLIGSLPTLVLLAVGVAVIVFLYRKCHRRRKHGEQDVKVRMQGGYESIFRKEEDTKENTGDGQDTDKPDVN